MESFLSLFIFHDSYVVSFLVLAITIIVVMLLLFNQKSPDSVVKAEMGQTDNVESALRRVLGEQRWSQQAGSADANAGVSTEDGDRVGALEKEVLDKDRTIADLNKQLTQAPSTSEAGDGEDSGPLKDKILELESRLQEYEIIEDDIADLSLYRTENEKLKAELAALQGGESATEVAEESVVEAPQDSVSSEPPIDDADVVVSEPSPVSGTDLVAEFEKVVNNQDHITDEQGESGTTVDEEASVGDGKVVVAGDDEVVTHEKLQGVEPDSKEEAEVFISDLKALKKKDDEG